MLILFVSLMAIRSVAKRKALNPAIWIIIGLVSYFAGPFLTGLIIGLTNPSLLYDDGAIRLIGIVAAIASLLIVLAIMELVAKNKASDKKGYKDVIDNDLY